MNASRFLSLGVAALLVTVSPSLSAADGDAEWEKVSVAIQELKSPKQPPKSREEAVEFLKKGLHDFDAAVTAAMKAASTNRKSLKVGVA